MCIRDRLVPVCVTQAAPLTVETWDSDKVVDYGYRFNMKFQPGITTYAVSYTHLDVYKRQDRVLPVYSVPMP